MKIHKLKIFINKKNDKRIKIKQQDASFDGKWFLWKATFE
jgi:hypothetical protein